MGPASTAGPTGADPTDGGPAEGPPASASGASAGSLTTLSSAVAAAAVEVAAGAAEAVGADNAVPPSVTAITDGRTSAVSTDLFMFFPSEMLSGRLLRSPREPG